MGWLTRIPNVIGWIGCSCGVRRMENELISLSDLITSSGKYPDRALSPELTQQVKDNGVKLINKVNQMLTELGIKEVNVSSGFRPSAVNAATPNSAKRSLHMIGSAVDILDDDNQTLGKLILSRNDLLEKYGLWLEDLDSTQGQNTNWCHLDQGVRFDRNPRMFKI
jgi:hypothetical protein